MAQEIILGDVIVLDPKDEVYSKHLLEYQNQRIGRAIAKHVDSDGVYQIIRKEKRTMLPYIAGYEEVKVELRIRKGV